MTDEIKPGDPIWVLESKHGWKVVWCHGERPQGGRDNGNYTIIADDLNRREAEEMAQRLRKS